MLDSSAKQITLRFVDSRFGLTGAIVSSFNTDSNGQLLAQSFQPVAGTSLPTGLANQLAGINLRFASETGLISGSISGLPNLRDNTGAPLQSWLQAAGA